MSSPGTDPAPPAPRPKLPRRLPAAVVVLGVLALALVIRPDGPAGPPQAAGPMRAVRPMAALLALVLLVGITNSYARRRGDERRVLLARAGTACAVLVATAAVVTPFALLFLGRAPHAPERPLMTATPTMAFTPSPERLPTPTPTRPPGKDRSFDWLSRIPVGHILAYALVAAVVMIVVAIVRALVLATRQTRRRTHALTDLPIGDLDAEELAEAVAAAARALEEDRKAREAVIACYSAMERRIAAAGVARQSYESPEELLDRATRGGLIGGTAGRRLTDLFQEARFSRHPITDSQRAAAREALQEIADRLQERQAAVGTATAAGQPTEAAR